MFKYYFKPDEEIKMLTSFDLSQMKKELKQNGNATHTRLSHENGFVIEMIEYPDKTILTANRELVENGDGTYDVLL